MRLLALVSAFAMCLIACGRSKPPAPPRETKLGLGVSTFELTNGLRVVLVADPRATEVQVTMRYRVGSVDDPSDAAGTAHLVEHLMFQQVVDGASLFTRIQDAASFFNGATTFDTTTYLERGPTSQLAEFLSIEAARLELRCSTLTDAVFEREREVVLNEARQRNESTEIIAAIHAAVFPAGHPYLRSPGGDEASLASITRSAACAFADAHYAPGNAVLVVSGNVSLAQLKRSLGPTLGRVTARPVAPPATVAAVPAASRSVETSAPIQSDLVLVAWPLPKDPRLRTQLRVLAPVLSSLVDSRVSGSVVDLELGDERAPMLAIAVVPGDDPVTDVKTQVEAAIRVLPGALEAINKDHALDRITFSAIKQAAITRAYARFEDPLERDPRFAGVLLGGIDPVAAIDAELRELRDLDHDAMARIARERLGLNRATVVVLSAHARSQRPEVVLSRAIHDQGQPRRPMDPAAARQPIPGALGLPELAGARMRELRNGLDVILLPLTSVPAIEMRLVFAAGTGDEERGSRGAAMVAAHALSFNPKFMNDLLLFAAAGGEKLVDVGTDHTTFIARGVDMHLDFLLTGLRRWVRDGTYDGRVFAAIRRVVKRTADEGALTDRWREALYGARHPYTHAGLIRHANGLSVAAATRFRATHYTPDNATIVIAGRFDPVIADGWIDYLFSDWTGTTERRSNARAAPEPVSLAREDSGGQVWLQIAIPAVSGDRAEQLVVAGMLSEIAGDVRHQLGASYGLNAQLVESRLASSYVISGAVDATRASEALQLLRDRIVELRSTSDQTARTFVAARLHVVAQLRSVAGSSTLLANRIQHDVAMARAPLSDARAASEVRKLTVDQITAALADLDLARASVLMRGARVAVDRAFGTLGRRPTYVPFDAAPTVAADTEDDPYTSSFDPSDFAEPTTLQKLHPRYSLLVGMSYTTGTLSKKNFMTGGIDERDVSGFTLSGQLTYRVTESTSVGIQASYGSLGDGAISPLAVQGVVQLAGLRRLWVAALAGAISKEKWFGDDPASTTVGVAVGAEGGVDLLKLGLDRLGVFARVETLFISDWPYQELSFGFAYRR